MKSTFTATFRAQKKLKYHYLDKYKLLFLLNKKQRISKENALSENITISVN